MKKLLKFISLLLLPLALSSCTIDLSRDDSSDSSSSGTIYPTELTISGDSELVIGETITLTASYTPSDVTNTTIKWTSSDSSIAKAFKSGKVKGYSEGEVTITASMAGENDTTITATHTITVSKPDATGITLNKTSTSLGFGKTSKLTATVDPEYANQKVNWTTSDSSVASLSTTTTENTFNSDKELELDPVVITAGSSVGSATITATSEDGNYTATCEVSVKEASGTTVMIYLCGADLESTSENPGYLNSGYSGYASMDLNEILSVENQPDDVNIIVETGGAKHWAISDISSSKLQRWEIRDQSFDLVESLTNASMGETSTLQEFVEWGLSSYPSEKYGLIMWNHGGALDGVCYDENFSDDSISADEMYEAITNARSNCGITDKLEWVAYDACLMAVQDVAEYNSYNFNYMLASQESEAGYGYDYDAWLPTLYDDSNISGADLLPVIGSTFLEEEKAWCNDQTQSVLDLSKMDAYKTAFESFASSLNSALESSSSKVSTLTTLINNAQKYGYYSKYDCYPYDVFDIEQALTNIKGNSTFSSLSSAITAVLSALNDMIIYEEHLSGTSGCGLNLFCPISHYNYNYIGKPLSGNGPETNFTNWSNVTEKIFKAWYYGS